MKKSRLIVICCASAAAVASVALVVLAALGFGKAGEAAERADKAVSAIDKVYKRNPFPSEENIDRAATNAAKRAEWTQKLAAAIDAGSYPAARAMTPGDFNRMREKAIETMTKAAPEGEDGKPAIPDNFAFGFDRYASGDPAKKVHVERLVRQLRTMEALVGIIYDAGIVRFEGAGREAFEDASEDSGHSSGSRGSRDYFSATASGAITVLPLPPPSGPVPMQRDRFEFQFAAREGALVSILDAIDSMRPFAMVTALALEKTQTRPDVVFPDDEASKRARAGGDDSSRRGRRRRGAQAEEEAAAAPAAAAGLNERPAPRSARLVSGPLREAPVRVSMTVDVFSAPPERSGNAGAGQNGGEED